MDDPGPWIALGFLGLAGVLALLVWRKERRARRLLTEAQGLDHARAVPLLLEALTAAEETPELEEVLLDELDRRYQALGLTWDPAPYRRLIAQYRRLAGMGTGGAAHAALIEGQQLKRRLVAGFPRPGA